MSAAAYATLADVYEWFIPAQLSDPEASVAAFGSLADLAPGARLLDCSAGTGTLAVGLALRGIEVTASDASAEMIARTRQRADRHGVAIRTQVLRWDELPGHDWGWPFDAVWCVGNSLVHSPGRAARVNALASMAAVLRPGGKLVLSSRNWERVRAGGSRVDVAPQLERRGEQAGVVIRTWELGADWDDVHHFDARVAILGPGGQVTSVGERLAFWPFTHTALDEDLLAAGLSPESSSYAEDTERYVVTATR